MSERVRSGLRIPYELNTWLILEAKRLGYSKNDLILQILWDWEERQPDDRRVKKNENISNE